MASGLTAGLALACSDAPDDRTSYPDEPAPSSARPDLGEADASSASADANASEATEGSADEHASSDGASAGNEPTHLEGLGETLALSSSDEAKQGESCEPGTVIECKVALPSQGSIANCFVGLRACEGGVWSGCLPEADALELIEPRAVGL